MTNKKDFILKTVVLVVSIAIILVVWFGFNTIDKQAAQIEQLQEDNQKKQNQIDYLEENNQTQTEVIEKSAVSVIQESLNVFVKSVFEVEQDNFEKRKEEAETVLTQNMFNEVFPENESYDVIYEYDINKINSYVDQSGDQASAYVTFEQSVTNVNNNEKEDSYVTIQVFLQKEGDKWIVNDFKQINTEPLS
ncbi:MerR type regulator [Virgibacillus salexigens]|uniref:MerR type regulator n=1 Tax=Virgibacillus massiliensis TaxID=1462526 RepID=UPI00136BBB07|nr:MerR type regulator [Virgibacillus massiliensis]MYL43894.1 MerR type regulator [Virgibacillus massiliensis]